MPFDGLLPSKGEGLKNKTKIISRRAAKVLIFGKDLGEANKIPNRTPLQKNRAFNTIKCNFACHYGS